MISSVVNALPNDKGVYPDVESRVDKYQNPQMQTAANSAIDNRWLLVMGENSLENCSNVFPAVSIFLLSLKSST
jgi:hypothetical protein